MKIRQSVRHWAAKRALEAPIIGDLVRDRLVDLHTRIFLDRADPEHREERRDHLDSLFAGTMDTYLAALHSGFPEAKAREITHIQANFDFYNHGWTEMMEFPVDEIPEHYERYQDFFEEHEIDIDQPLGEFRPESIPEAPATPDRLEHPEHPFAEGGYADDVYVQRDGELERGGTAAPADVDLEQAPGISEDRE